MPRHIRPPLLSTGLVRHSPSNWWLIGLRGLLGLVFGVIAFIVPIATILALVLLFSAYVLVDGVFTIFAAIRAAQQREHWGLLALQGIASVAAGLFSGQESPSLPSSCSLRRGQSFPGGSCSLPLSRPKPVVGGSFSVA
jgi:hypothetical protein